ncbi:MAG TPA: hypothetical protein VN963_03575, partial [bacterium]|nr:hypothetical protein [bacterium]
MGKRNFPLFNITFGIAIFVSSYLVGTVARSSVLVLANDPNIQYSGRFDFSNPLAPRFDWPAVSISAVFQGTSIGILLTDGNNNYNAFIDGHLQQVI